MRISVEHTTSYQYEEAIVYTIQSLKLTPGDFVGQQVLDWRVGFTHSGKRADPDPPMAQFVDSFGNVTHTLVVNRPHDALTITVKGTVLTEERTGIVAGAEEPFPLAGYLRETALTAPSQGIKDLANGCRDDANPLGAMHSLLNAVRDRVDYKVGTTGVETTAADALSSGRGVCQDHAHVFIACARHLGFPARYVSGYMADGDGSETFEASHAWAEAHIPQLGWVGFDPANRQSPTEAYLRVATGLDYREAAPIRGLRRGAAGERLEVAVRVKEQDGPYQAQSQQTQ